MYYQQPKTLYLKGRPVSSFEEVKAIPIDFDGSIFFFPDAANKRIYTKQINMDGTSSLNMYQLTELPVEELAPAASQYVTKDEFLKTIEQIKEALRANSSTASKEKVEFNI